MIVSLSGDAKEAQSDLEGRYFLQASNNDYRENYWIQENGTSVLAYDKEFDNWNIGYQSYIGIYSPDKYIPNPLLASTWYYVADGNWKKSKDIFVGPGRPGNLDLIDLNLVV